MYSILLGCTNFFSSVDDFCRHFIYTLVYLLNPRGFEVGEDGFDFFPEVSFIAQEFCQLEKHIWNISTCLLIMQSSQCNGKVENTSK